MKKAIKTHYIYGLHLKGDDEIRYVGATTNPKQRLYVHRTVGARNGALLEEWRRGQEKKIQMVILDKTEHDPKGLELHYAAKLFRDGHRILNMNRPRRSTKEEKQRHYTIL